MVSTVGFRMPEILNRESPHDIQHQSQAVLLIYFYNTTNVKKHASPPILPVFQPMSWCFIFSAFRQEKVTKLIEARKCVEGLMRFEIKIISISNQAMQRSLPDFVGTKTGLYCTVLNVCTKNIPQLGNFLFL